MGEIFVIYIRRFEYKNREGCLSLTSPHPKEEQTNVENRLYVEEESNSKEMLTLKKKSII